MAADEHGAYVRGYCAAKGVVPGAKWTGFGNGEVVAINYDEAIVRFGTGLTKRLDATAFADFFARFLTAVNN